MRTSLKRFSASSRLVLVRVRDQGSGIPAGAHERIFQPFRQADLSDRRAHGGTGLGLAIVRDVAQIYGGRITLEQSEDLGGLLARLTLPAG